MFEVKDVKTTECSQHQSTTNCVFHRWVIQWAAKVAQDFISKAA
jgi:hypothetical protein